MMNRKAKCASLSHALLVAVAVVAGLYQIVLLMDGYSVLWLKRAWRTRDMSAQERNAVFHLGSKGARFMEFLRSTVPVDASVVVPQGAGELSQQSTLQFFLMPRTIPGCSCGAVSLPEASEACLVCLRKEDNYVPSIGEFPPVGALEGWKVLIPFTDSGWFHGVYAPAPETGSGGMIGEVAPHALPVWLAAIVDVSLLVALWILGCNTAALFLKPLGWMEALGLGIPLGMGALTLSVFLLSWAGLRIDVGLFTLAWALLMGGILLARRLANRRAGRHLPRELANSILSSKGRLSLAVILLGGVLVFIGLQALVISVSRGYSIFDALANWALKGYAIALEGSIWAGSRWGGHALAYPQNLHLAIAMFRVFDGDILPGSKLLDPCFSVAILAGCFRFWRLKAVSVVDGLLGAILLLSVPVLFIHTTIGYANLCFSAYLVLGTLWLLEGMDLDRLGVAALGALLLGFAAWTRPEGIAFAASIALGILAGAWLVRRRRLSLLAGLLPFLAVAGIWLAFGQRYLGKDEVSQIAPRLLGALSDGSASLASVLAPLGVALAQLATPSHWGLLIPLAGFLVILCLARSGLRCAREGLPTLLAILAGLAFELAVLIVSSYSWSNFIEDGLDRAFLPLGVLVFVALWGAVAGKDSLTPTKAADAPSGPLPPGGGESTR